MKSNHLRFFIPVFALIMLLINQSCKKDDIISTDPALMLSFNNDSIIFDTVFTTIGSTTKTLMIYNKSDKKLNISNVSLIGGTSSPFRINLDGEAGTLFNEIEINGNDSLFLFVRVTIDPMNENNPYIVEDQLSFTTNGNEQNIKLIAWGQDAHYIVADTYVDGFPKFKIVADSLEDITWTNDRPYVIYGYAVINSYGSLTIEPGTRIYFHDGGGLWAYADGQLQVLGTLEEQVTFQGDRLEHYYDQLPGQWDRIWLMESKPGTNHIIRNAVIRNAFIGVQAESFLRAAENSLILENVIIENMNGFGIFSRIYNIVASNIVVGNCGAYCLALTGGGYYDFKQTTIANYYQYGARTTPAVAINNYLVDTLNNPIPIPISFNMANSIIYGTNENEFLTDLNGGADSLYFLDHCLIRTSMNMENPENYSNITKNEDPLFLKVEVNDYRLDTLSPAIGIGDANIALEVPVDILGNERITRTDDGAYQFEPGQSDR